MYKLLSILTITLLISFMHADALPQKGKESKLSVSVVQTKNLYTCPMHQEVTSSEQLLSAHEKILRAKELLKEGKLELAQDGKYNCCIKDACDRCALDHQNCPCADDVKAGKAVCPECYGGWQRGDGVVPGVKASKVKGSFHNHKH